MRLQAQLVTLSACETGINKVMPGEEIIGFTGSLLAAGAGSVVLSLWNVNDAAARELMTAFYTGIASGKSTVSSLQHAQSNMAGRGIHPYFWAPFFVVGRT
jgi:CHAT domain-containing protein